MPGGGDGSQGARCSEAAREEQRQKSFSSAINLLVDSITALITRLCSPTCVRPPQGDPRCTPAQLLEWSATTTAAAESGGFSVVWFDYTPLAPPLTSLAGASLALSAADKLRARAVGGSSEGARSVAGATVLKQAVSARWAGAAPAEQEGNPHRYVLDCPRSLVTYLLQDIAVVLAREESGAAGGSSGKGTEEEIREEGSGGDDSSNSGISPP